VLVTTVVVFHCHNEMAVLEEVQGYSSTAAEEAPERVI
jgi:hypothetical protein